MTTDRENYLQVTFDRVRGLKLSWNFKDLSGKEKYFRHLLVLCSPEENESKSLLENFYRRMKQGDLLTCTYLHNFYGIATAPWF